MVIGNVVEEMDFFLLQEQACRNGMNRGVSPSFVEESAILVKRAEVIYVGWGPQPVKISNFKVGPLHTILEGRFFGIVTDEMD